MLPRAPSKHASTCSIHCVTGQCSSLFLPLGFLVRWLLHLGCNKVAIGCLLSPIDTCRPLQTTGISCWKWLMSPCVPFQFARRIAVTFGHSPASSVRRFVRLVLFLSLSPSLCLCAWSESTRSSVRAHARESARSRTSTPHPCLLSAQTDGEQQQQGQQQQPTLIARR